MKDFSSTDDTATLVSLFPSDYQYIYGIGDRSRYFNIFIKQFTKPWKNSQSVKIGVALTSANVLYALLFSC